MKTLDVRANEFRFKLLEALTSGKNTWSGYGLDPESFRDVPPIEKRAGFEEYLGGFSLRMVGRQNHVVAIEDAGRNLISISVTVEPGVDSFALRLTRAVGENVPMIRVARELKRICDVVLTDPIL